MQPPPQQRFDERSAFEAEQSKSTARASAALAAGVVEGHPLGPGSGAHVQWSGPTQEMQDQQRQQNSRLPLNFNQQQNVIPQQQPQQHAAPPPSSGPGIAYYSTPQPIVGLPVRGPVRAPQPGYVVTGFQTVMPTGGCSCDLKTEGWFVVVILLFLVPCVACVPCCISDCFQQYQVPIYGPPGSAPPSYSISSPAH